MSSSDAQTTADRQRLYRLTNRILDTYSFHFIAISILFIPFTFCASTVVQFYFTSSPDTTDVDDMFDPFNLILIKTIISSSRNNLLTFKTIITLVISFCSVVLPTVAGIALITYSTNQAIHARPVTFSSTIKSLSRSYVPLLYTFNAGLIKLVTIFLVFTLSPVAITEAIKALGFHFDLSLFSVFVNTILSYALAATIVFFVIIWGSASTITVLESKSGFASLRQSANQSTEFRRHSFSIVFLTVFVMGTGLANFTFYLGSKANWILVLHVGAKYLQSSLIILLYLVANTVLYVQCKVPSGEETSLTAGKGEVFDEYFKLVENDNDGEIVHEADKEFTKGAFTYMWYMLLIVWMILLCLQFYSYYVYFIHVI